jgi:hypothetical protein
MVPGATIAIVHQPRKPGATDVDADDAGRRFQALLHEAGFREIKMEKRLMKPVSTICLIGVH